MIPVEYVDDEGRNSIMVIFPGMSVKLIGSEEEDQGYLAFYHFGKIVDQSDISKFSKAKAKHKSINERLMSLSSPGPQIV